MAHSHVSFSDPAHRGETVWSGRLRAISWASELKNQTTNQITRIAHVIHTWLYNNVLTHPTLCPDPLSLLWVWSGNAGNETSSVLQTSPYLIQFVYIQVCIRVIACETKQRNMFWWVVGLRGTVYTLHYLLHMCSDVADNQCNCAKWANYSFFGTHAPWHAHLLTHSPEDVCILLWVCEWRQLHYTTGGNCAVPTDVMTIHSPFGPWNMFIIQVASSEVHAEFVGTEACTVHVYMRKVNLRNF